MEGFWGKDEGFDILSELHLLRKCSSNLVIMNGLISYEMDASIAHFQELLYESSAIPELWKQLHNTLLLIENEALSL